MEYRLPDDFYYPRQVPITTTADHVLAAKVKDLGKTDPDHRPAVAPIRTTEGGRLLHFHIDVQKLGVMEMIVDGEPHTGRLIYKGMKLCRMTK